MKYYAGKSLWNEIGFETFYPLVDILVLKEVDFLFVGRT